MTEERQRTGFGISLKIGAVLCFTIMGALIKGTEGRVPTGEVVFFRSFFAIPIMIGWLAYVGQLHEGVRTSRPFGHMWRGFIGTTAMGLMFTALTLLPLPEVTALPTGRFAWHTLTLELLNGDDAVAGLEALLPEARQRRQSLLRIAATGRARLADRTALSEAIGNARPDFAYLDFDDQGLATECEAGDLDRIDRAGALREAADALLAESADTARSAEERAVAGAALARLYAYAQAMNP
mgnify:CR=1 FL=1